MSDSEKIRILLDQGLTAYGLGNREAALEAWNTVLAMDPGNTKAREYIRFVEENWGPKQEREEGPAKPYRPDEGSGEISAPNIKPVEPAESPPPPPEEPGSFEKDAFTPPAKPILQSDRWGDLYDFDKREQTAEPAPEPKPEPKPGGSQQPSQFEGEPPKELSPEQEQIEPLGGDWSNVLTPEEKAAQDHASTLPPHPGESEELEEIEIVEDGEEPPQLPPVELAPELPRPEPPELPDPPAPTKKYDAVPTMVRPLEQAVPPEAIPPHPPEPPPVEEKVERDTLDRFPEDPELAVTSSPMPEPVVPAPQIPEPSAQEPLAPEPGMAFYQTPRPETTPPLGSPILEQPGSDLLDLVGGNEPPSAPAVPGISAVSEAESLMKGARDMLELDDFSGAIELLDKVLELDAGNSEARQLRQDSERELLAMLSSKLGDLNRTPRVRMSQDEIIWLNLDNRAGFVLSLVDGSLSLDEIISICGLPQLEGMRILVQLLQEKVIEIG